MEHGSGWSRNAAILVCCLARPDLAELRPHPGIADSAANLRTLLTGSAGAAHGR